MGKSKIIPKKSEVVSDVIYLCENCNYELHTCDECDYMFEYGDVVLCSEDKHICEYCGDK